MSKSAPKKGQTSLFSFFQKPAASTGNIVDNKIISSVPSELSKPVLPAPSSVKADVFTVPIAPKAAEIIPAKTTESRKRVIDDDDEEEWNEDQSLKPKKACTKKAPVDSESEFSGDGASDSDSEDATDDDLVDSSDDEGYAPSSRKKKTTTKKSVVPKKMEIKVADPTPLKSAAHTPYKTPMKSPSLSGSSVVTPSSNTSYTSPQFSGQTATESPSYDAKDMPAIGASGVGTKGSHGHNKWTWLHPANIRDKHGNRPDHPDYDPRTVKAPASFLAEQTPGMRQWADFKIENMDTILFFKVGKFYELFHMDADVGVECLDLLYMKGEKAHCGFPEISYGKYAMALVAQGHRVARVEQTETPDQLKERNDSATKGKKKEKVVLREMCSILTRGTRTYCHLDDLTTLRESTDSVSGARYDLPSESLLVCIQELQLAPDAPHANDDAMEEDECRAHAVVEYGVCVVDTVLNNVVFAQFHDDEQRTRLRTMISQFKPSEIVAKFNGLSEATVGAVHLLCPKIAWEFLRGREMPTADVAARWLREEDYFGGKKGDASGYPAVLQSILSALPTDAAAAYDGSPNSSLVMSAFGGVLWQLRRSLIDLQIISCGRCFGYVPPDQCVVTGGAQASSEASENPTTSMLLSHTQSQDESAVYGADTGTSAASGAEASSGATSNPVASNRFMTLDAIALSNLEILVNNYDKTAKGSLWSFVNHTKTAMGRRLLHDWVCKPLFSVDAIGMRAAAVEDLLSNVSVEMGSARNILKTLPDLERLLGRIHTNGHKKRSLEHPDSRAVFFEAATHNTRKIKDFSDVLSGFEASLRAVEVFAGKGRYMDSVLLQRITQAAGSDDTPTGKFPFMQMQELLKYYRSIFDEKQAKRDGNIKPLPGVDPEYDAAKSDIAAIETALQEYLREMKRTTNINELVYWGSNKDRYQIEVPISKTGRLPADWMTKSQKKTHRRFHTPVIQKLFEKLQDAESRMLVAQKDTLRRIFEKFDDNQQVWRLAVTCISTLDALMSLALVSSAPNYSWPIMRERTNASSTPSICIENGRHPMLEQTLNEK